MGGSEPREAGSVGALIFDMDGTMIDSMPHHTQSWLEFCRRHCLQIDVKDLMRRTTGRTGAECMQKLFQRRPDELAGPHVLAYAKNFSELIESNFLESLHVATA